MSTPSQDTSGSGDCSKSTVVPDSGDSSDMSGNIKVSVPVLVMFINSLIR